jgi:hypothetical protein
MEDYFIGEGSCLPAEALAKAGRNATRRGNSCIL